MTELAPREEEFQRASRFDRQGNYVQSLEIYLDLMKFPEVRQRAYEGALRAYLILERWEELERFLRDRITQNPADIEARLLLGQSLARRGDHAGARQVWDEAVSLGRGEAAVLERSARLAAEAGMTEDAIEMFLEARARRKVPALYAQDLSVLYLRSGRTDRAVEETLGWLQANPQQEVVIQGELRRILWDPDHRDAARKVLLDRARTRPEWVELMRTLVGLWVEMGECEGALELAEQSRRAVSPPMISLLALGDELRRNGCEETAARAYRLAIEGVPGDRRAARLRLGALWMDAGRDLDAASEFRQFLEEFPDSPDAPEARYDLGRALLRSGQPDRALEELRALIRGVPRHPRVPEARFLVAECLIGLRRLDEAAMELESVPVEGKDAAAEERLYRRGEILFLAGRFDDALESFQSLIGSFPKGRFVNDAVSRVLLISGNRLAGEDALSLYAGALYFRNLGQSPQALAGLDSLLARFPDGPLAGEALLAKAEIQLDAGSPERALRVLDELLGKQPVVRQAPQAMQLKGDIHAERMGDPATARAIYESMLMAYPESPLVDQVRRKLRRLEEAMP